jgi:hypothetical protein
MLRLRVLSVGDEDEAGRGVGFWAFRSLEGGGGAGKFMDGVLGG